MKGTAKRGTWNFSRNLENFGAHKERELVEGGDKINGGRRQNLVKISCDCF